MQKQKQQPGWVAAFKEGYDRLALFRKTPFII
jgi:hypothetical protein